MNRIATGVFYHPSFSLRSYRTTGAWLADVPRGVGWRDTEEGRPLLAWRVEA